MKKIISIMMALIIITSLSGSLSLAATDNGSVVGKEHEDNLKKIKSLEKSSVSNEVSEQNEIDEAYQRVENEERYIVALINSLSDRETTLSNWEYNLKFLKENYQNIAGKSKSSNINMNAINSYIEAYEYVSLLKNSPAEKLRDTSAKAGVTASYSLTAAVNYAETYYSSYNSAYPDWNSYGGDCANFVSQSLYAGGKVMKGTPGTDSAAQNFANWFSKGSAANTANVSSTWRGADAFRNYWQSNAVAYKQFSSYSVDAYNYGYRGDAVSLLNSNGRAYHTLIVVNYGSNSDLIYAAHTSSTKTGSLRSAASGGYGFIIYSM